MCRACADLLRNRAYHQDEAGNIPHIGNPVQPVPDYALREHGKLHRHIQRAVGSAPAHDPEKRANYFELALQLVISFPFGYLIDASVWLLGGFEPKMYAARIAFLLLGCAVVALGVYVQVTADVVMLPGDAFVRAVAKVKKKEFGSVRVVSDIIMVATAALLSIIFLHNLNGAREGTVIAALLTGNLVKLYRRLSDRILKRK